MKTKEQRINEIESSPEYNGWRYDRNRLRDLLDGAWREGMTYAAQLCVKEFVGTNDGYVAKHACEQAIRSALKRAQEIEVEDE